MNILKIFRNVALLEGISYLFLLFIAMPLKYMADLPIYVKYAGQIHGILFVAYVILLFFTATQKGWSFKKCVYAFVMSVIPFGAFIFDKQLKREEQAQLKEVPTKND